MRPERFVWIHPFSARSLPIPAAILLALMAVALGSARAATSAPQFSAGPAYNSDSFIKELGRLKAGLESARNSTGALRSYGENLPETWTVETGGRRYEVPTDLLRSRLVKAERQPELRGQQVNLSRDYLDALAAETASLSEQPATRTDSARAKLDAILSRPEYSRTRQPSWWDRICERINEMLFNALERILKRVGGQASLGHILLWIGVCAAAIFIAYFLFRHWFRASRGEEMALQAAAMPVKSWQEWVFAARDAAGRGDYRMAVHCAYWAGIARLQDLGALAPDRAKTPREYLRALEKSKWIVPESVATRQQALALLTSRLEKIWYGYQIATEADFRDSLAQLETLGCHLP
jgi:hypothetical protein